MGKTIRNGKTIAESFIVKGNGGTGDESTFLKNYIEKGGKFGYSTFNELDLSEVNAFLLSNSSMMFYDCSSLTSITFGNNFNTSSVEDMGSMFNNCINLTSIVFGSNFNTSNVTNMGSMFQSCSNLTTLDLSNFNTSNVRYMGYMFSYCNLLTSLDLSNFDTSKVGSMFSMFEGCNKLTNLNLSNFNTSSVEDMGSMFNNCNALTTLDVSGFVTDKVTNMAGMFNACNALTKLDVSNFSYRRINGEIFSFIIYNSGLTSLKLGAEVPPVSSDILQGCTHYGFGETDGKILVPKGMLSQYQTATNWSNFAQYMEEYDVPETTYNFVTIGGTSVDSITTSKGLQTAPVTTPDDSSLIFIGWYFDEQFTNKVIFPYNNLKGGIITMYAKYGTPNPSTKALAKIINQNDIGVTTFDGEITDDNESPTVSGYQWKSCWYKFTPTESGDYYISQYNGSPTSDLNIVIENENGSLLTEYDPETQRVYLEAGNTYYYAISMWDGRLGTISFTLSKN